MGTTWLGPIRELFSSKANLYRIQLSIMSQLLAQWSGANSITIYAPQYFAMMYVLLYYLLPLFPPPKKQLLTPTPGAQAANAKSSSRPPSSAS